MQRLNPPGCRVAYRERWMLNAARQVWISSWVQSHRMGTAGVERPIIGQEVSRRTLAWLKSQVHCGVPRELVSVQGIACWVGGSELHPAEATVIRSAERPIYRSLRVGHLIQGPFSLVQCYRQAVSTYRQLRFSLLDYPAAL